MHRCQGAVPSDIEMKDVRMRWLLPVFLIASVCPVASPVWAAGKLTVYTYESFVAEWGPGPKVKKAFEAQCGCDLELIAVGDAVAMLTRLKIEGQSSPAEIVLGLDNNLVAEAKATGLFVPHPTGLSANTVPGGFSDEVFVPFDYGHFAVVYDSQVVKTPPTSLDELVNGDPEMKIAIQDPRTSTPGLGLLLWMKSVYGDKAGDAWSKLKGRVLTVSPDWSGAYALLTKGEAPMAFSYVTSPAYHRIAEGNDRYRAAAFSEGHYLQVEVAGMTNKGVANPLAGQFMEFMTSPAFQDIIPETNWMFPAGKTTSPLSQVWDELVKPAKTLVIAAGDVAANRKTWIDEWLTAMGR